MPNEIKTLYLALLAIIPISSAIRIVVCLIKMNTDLEQANLYKRRAYHTGLFVILATCVLSLVGVVYSYLT